MRNSMFVKISVLNWADQLASYCTWVMMAYLTEVWNLGIVKAASIVNIWSGLADIMQILSLYLVDVFMGNYLMLLLSSIAYAIGLGFLYMSTPSSVLSNFIIGTCSEYKPECIGQTQRILFLTALALIALGVSGHAVSLDSFLRQNIGQNIEEHVSIFIMLIWVLVAIIGMLAPFLADILLPYMKAWSIQFAVPAICTFVATIVFISGTSSYEIDKSPRCSPLTVILRVFVASSFNRSYKVSYGQQSQHSHILSCLDKAAIDRETSSQGEKEKNKWTFCTIEEVEDTKRFIFLAPICIPLIVAGLVISFGNTFFIEQASHMDQRVGRLKVPLTVFLVFYNLVKFLTARYYSSHRPRGTIIPCWKELDRHLKRLLREIFPILVFFLIFTCVVLCFVVAAGVEMHRLRVIRKHGLLNKPDERIPMSVFWLLPQFFLLAFADGLYDNSVDDFFSNYAPSNMRNYWFCFHKGVTGLGTMGSVLLVYVVGKVSEVGGNPSWFQYTLNKSRLDNYYWTLSVLCALNFIAYYLVLRFYPLGIYFAHNMRLDRRKDRIESFDKRIEMTESPDRRTERTESLDRRKERTESLDRGTDRIESLGRRIERTESLGRRTERTKSLDDKTEIIESLDKRAKRTKSLDRRTERIESLEI